MVVNARKSWIRRYRPRRRNGSSEVRVIEDIERVHARLQTEALHNPEKPAESDVEVHIMGAAYGVASHIAVRTQRIRCKRILIQILNTGRSCAFAMAPRRWDRLHCR